MTEPNMPIPGESARPSETPGSETQGADVSGLSAPAAESAGSESQIPAALPQASDDQAGESDSQAATAAQPQSSGDPRVDEATAGLDAAAAAPPAEQVEAYESAHRVLQDTLATIDEA